MAYRQIIREIPPARIDFDAYVKVTLPLLAPAQLAVEVAERLKDFNAAENGVAARVTDGIPPTAADWMVIDVARTYHRLAEREMRRRAAPGPGRR